MRRNVLWLDALAIAAAVAVKLAEPSATWVEAHYSNGIYPALDRGVRTLTGAVPLCVADVLFVVALTLLGLSWTMLLRRRAFVRAGLGTVAGACVLYVWFVASWGLNYARVPLADKIPVHAARTDRASVTAFANHVADELSRNGAAAHREFETDAALGKRLTPTFEATIRRLGDRSTFAPPRVKPTLFEPLLRASGTTGFTDPWTHEVNLDQSLFAFERPAVYAHEWAHLAGFADESEANFISVIACTTSGDPLLAYSGWILVWFNLPGDIRITHRVSRTAYADLMAIRARYQKNVNPQVERASQVAYDKYLKSNHVKAGVASYRLFIRWMTGADFDRRGLPLVRAAR